MTTTLTTGVCLSSDSCEKNALDWVAETTEIYFSQFYRLGSKSKSKVLADHVSGHLLAVSSHEEKDR